VTDAAVTDAAVTDAAVTDAAITDAAVTDAAMAKEAGRTAMHVLVTGAAGFIGSHVAAALLDRGDVVTGVDDFNDFYDPARKEENAALLLPRPGFQLVRGSILDDGVLDRAFAPRVVAGATRGPDVVVHLAAWAGVRPSIARPALYQRQNVEGTVAVLDRARATAAGAPPRFVFASSSSVYGDNARVPFHEDDRVDHPVSPYAATKRAGELLVGTYSHLYGIFATSLRFFTVYGPRQRPEMAIHKFAQLIVDGQPVPQYGDGSTSRDYTYINDIVKGVIAAVDRATGPTHRIYNLGNATTVRLDELIARLAQSLRVPARVDLLPPQPGDVPVTFADVTRARDELGYVPTTPLHAGLERFATWFLARHGRAP
jgi:UDP-glucuronate 4-epimerase